MKPHKRFCSNERGIALLLVLWVVIFLAFVCAEFSWTMRTEISAATNFKEGTQAYYAAEAGINRAIIEILRASAESGSLKLEGDSPDEEVDDTNKKDADVTDDAADTDDTLYGEGDVDDMELWVSGGGPYRFEVGDFYCEVSIIDESNKININDFLKQAKQDPLKLKTLLRTQLGLEGEEVDIIADSLIDWWDVDDETTGEFGAEDEYYESLDPPHFCRNGPLPAMEDCLSVSGITEEIFYGPGRHMEERIELDPEELEQLIAAGSLFDPEDDELLYEDDINPMGLGLVDIFSVHSNASTTFEINVNTASLEQLMLLEGMQLESAEDIIEERAERLFESSTDRLPKYANYEVWEGMIRVDQPDDMNNFIVLARGFSRDGRTSRSIRCNLYVSKSECIISNWRVDG